MQSEAFGCVKMVLASKKSYLLRRDDLTGKWPLIVEITKGDHRAVCMELFEVFFYLRSQALRHQLSPSPTWWSCATRC